jgi:Tfp pilus assembly protein PilF
VLAAALVAAALALYWRSLGHPLVFDDSQLSGAAPGFGPRVLANASFYGVQLLGGELAWQRAVNVLLHGAVGAALFGFLARLFETVLGDARARWTAFLGALAFVLHPVAVYGVAYLVQRSILMATLFSLLSLWCFLEGVVRKRVAWQVAGALLYLLAVLSKEHAIMLPAVAVALLILVRGLSRKFAPGFALLGIAALIVVYQSRALIGTAYEPLVQDIAGADSALALPLSMINQAYLYFRYLLVWLVPCPCWMSADLRVAFPVRLLEWPQSAGAVAYLVYAVAAGALLLRRGSAGLLGFGLLYPWLLGLTELVAVRAQEPFVLYRSYLWMSGLPAILPALLPRAVPRLRHAALTALCVALVPLALDRLATFSDPLKLWDDAVRKQDEEKAAYRERAYINRGEFLRGAGRNGEALADFDRAIALNPRLAEGYVRRATVHLETGNAAAALPDLDRALALDPHNAPAFTRRCHARVLLRQGEEALADCQRATALDPADPESWLLTGMAQQSVGRRDAAVASFRRALEACKGNAVPACAALREILGGRKP